MKLLLLSTSPKRKWSNSKYFLNLVGLGLKDCDITEIALQGPKDYPEIFRQFEEIDGLIISLPVYVDAIPAHLLEFLELAEAFTKEKALHFKVYGVANCGFYEGNQCALTLATMRSWCLRGGLSWQGGIGIGAGEMLGVLRIVPFIGIAIACLQLIVGLLLGLLQGNVDFATALSSISIPSLLINTAVYFLFSFSLFRRVRELTNSIKQGKAHTEQYTTVSFCPAFLFVAFANLFWIIRAMLHGVPFWKMKRRIL